MANKRNLIIIKLLVLMVAVLLAAAGCKLTVKDPPEPQTPGETYDPQALWEGSGHADATAEAFVHWDEDDPPVVPTSCARCHSNDGFLDFVDNGVVDSVANPGVLGCDVCHTDSSTGITRDLGSVTFPSGNVIGGLQEEAICMQCHQGRSSKPDVDSYLVGRGAVAADTVYPSLSFRNIHYFAAAATLYGTFALGGYQYPGSSYDGKFTHVEGYARCIGCHDPHSLEVKTEECSQCHSNLSTAGAAVASSSLHDIRYKGSYIDYDGDGNLTEGIYYEIVTFQEYLVNAMWSYSKDITGSAIVYDSHTYPYFFVDTNENGVADPGEANYGNQFRNWTPRLMKAAYNYQVSLKDPGGFAHGGKYIIQLLYDSLMDVNGAAPNPIALPQMRRNDEGHFNGSAEAWRHWDSDGEVPGSCARCHSGMGVADFLEHGENEEAPVSNGMMCSNCHTSPFPAIREVDSVSFPSGAQLSMPDGSSNLCLICHQGRASKKDVDDKITAAGGGGNHSFTNIHYFPVAAILFGTEAGGGYEYPFKTYVGRQTFFNHGEQFDTCVECHMGTKGLEYGVAHNVQSPNPADCVVCHGKDVSQPYPGYDPGKFMFSGIRPETIPDYDGDGNVTESLKSEIQGLEAALYAQMQAYGFMIGSPIIYDSHAYPYFFKDVNGNGIVDPGEANYGNQYRFDDIMLRAAYNYQTSRKEPSGFIHNSMYVAQLLVDSIGDLGGNVAPYTWR
jgi:hypothetical protein